MDLAGERSCGCLSRGRVEQAFITASFIMETAAKQEEAVRASFSRFLVWALLKISSTS